MRKFSIISILIFMATFALLTVSYSKSWAHINFLAEYSDGSTKWIPYIEWYPLNAKDILNDVTVKFSDDSETWSVMGFKLNSFIQISNASLSFAILAWVVSLVMIILSIADTLEVKLPPIGKFLGFAVFLFSLLSFLIYLGAPAAKRKDCDAQRPDCDNLNFAPNKFFGTFTTSTNNDSYEFKYGPSSGWNCIVIACSVSLVGSIFNIFFFNHQNV
ncbi:hypothetical protein RB653_000367 [Dictyostelium firmibasis]|uniref:Uncharacterized protein n=1 Tax=Dictyostelium firmibasis TaxID=79012 RepID=A0AAN7YUA5_9MYCE